MPSESPPLTVTNVRLSNASAADRAAGIIGFLSFTIAGAVVIDDVTLRRTLSGDLALGFPRHKDRYGIEHPTVRPADDGSRRAITAAVLEALGMDADTAKSGAGQQVDSAP